MRSPAANHDKADISLPLYLSERSQQHIKSLLVLEGGDTQDVSSRQRGFVERECQIALPEESVQVQAVVNRDDPAREGRGCFHETGTEAPGTGNDGVCAPQQEPPSQSSESTGVSKPAEVGPVK